MKKNETRHDFHVTIVTEKDIPNIADVVGGRLWSIDGVRDKGVVVTPILPNSTEVTSPEQIRRSMEEMSDRMRKNLVDPLVEHTAFKPLHSQALRDAAFKRVEGVEKHIIDTAHEVATAADIPVHMLLDDRYIGNVPNLTIAEHKGNGHAADNQPGIVNMDACERIAQESLDKHNKE